MERPELEEQLRSIDVRLSRIEKQLHLTPESAHKTPSSQKSALSKMELVGGKPGSWLGIVAVICFILAAAFIIKLSIDTGWLTPVRQISLAYLLGLILIACGVVLLDLDRAYASLLPGAGVIILYLTTFAAHQFYFLFSFMIAISITSVISLACIGLYLKIKHDIYALTAAIGAYLSPVILDLNTNAIFSIYYFLICSLAFATISIWVKSRTLTVISAYLAILVNALVGFRLGQDQLIALILPVHFLIFSLGSYLYTSHTRTMLSESESWSFFPVLILFYAMEYYFIERIHPDLAPWVSLAFAVFLISLYLWAKRWFPNQSLGSEPMILAFTTLVFFHAIYLELLSPSMRPWLFGIITLAVCYLPHSIYRQKNLNAFGIPALALLAILGIEYINILIHLINGYEHSWMLVAFFSFISIWFLFLTKRHFLPEKEYGYALLSTAHLLAITGLYQLTDQEGSFAVSASWLLYAIAIILLAFYRRDKIMGNSAIIVLSVAAAKVLLYDVSNAPTVVRILCLLLTGAVLYLSGFLIRKMSNWKNA